MFLKTPPHRLFARKYNHRWTNQKPPFPSEVDWGHPLAPKTVCFVFNEYAGLQTLDLASNDRKTINQGQWVKGQGLELAEAGGAEAGDDYTVSIGDGIIDGINQGSVALKFKQTESYNTYATLFQFSGTTFADLNMYRNNNSTELAVRVGESALMALTTGIHLWNGDWHSIVLTWDSGANETKLYVNGILRDTDSTTIGTPSNDTDGRVGFEDGFAPSGILEYFYIYDWLLDLKDVKELYQLPYQFILPANRKKFWQVKATDKDLIPGPRKRHGTEKPEFPSEVNWAHPLAKGLVMACISNADAGNVLTDIVGGTDLSLEGTPTWEKGGVALTDDNYAKSTDVKFSLTDAYTIVINTVDGWTNVDNWGRIIAIDDASNTATPQYVKNSDTDQIRVYHGSPSIALTTATITGLADTKQVIFVWDGSNIIVYYDGDEVDNESFSDSLLTQAKMELNHDVTGGSGYGSDCTLDALYIYNRAFSAKEVLSLHESPYQFLLPLKRRIIPVQKPVKLRLGHRK